MVGSGGISPGLPLLAYHTRLNIGTASILCELVILPDRQYINSPRHPHKNPSVLPFSSLSTPSRQG